jgi:ATP-dependent Clp protease, protease subunit
MAFRVNHTFEGVASKPESIIIPSLLQGHAPKPTHWEPVVVSLCDDIDSDTAVMVDDQLKKAEETGQPFVPFYIHSNGGEVYALMSIIESMKNCKIPIYTYTSGYAASCAACIFTCGQRRFIGPHARLLIHDVSVDFSNESNMTSSNLKVEANEMRSLNKIIFQIMALNTGHEANFFRNLIKTKRNNDIYVDAEQAMEWRMATDIGYPVVKVTHTTQMTLDMVKESMSLSGKKKKTRKLEDNSSTESAKKKRKVDVDIESSEDEEEDDDEEDEDLTDLSDQDTDSDEEKDISKENQEQKTSKKTEHVDGTTNVNEVPFVPEKNTPEKNTHLSALPTRKTRSTKK